MTYILVLVFLAGPLAGPEYGYNPERTGKPYEFKTLDECLARAKEQGPVLAEEFANSASPDVKYKFKLSCKAQGPDA